MRELPWSFSLVIAAMAIIVSLGLYMRVDTSSDTNIQAMVETVRSTAISNVNYKSRVQPGEVYIQKDSFESDFKRIISNSGTANFSSEVSFDFDYLDNNSGSTRAIRVVASDNGKEYGATVIVDISDQGWEEE